MALNSYISNTQLLLHDTTAAFYSTANLTTYINQARNRIAAEAQCIRVLPPSSANISSITPGATGSGYSGATKVAISAPDIVTGTTATVTPVIVGNAVTGYTITNAGNGYLTVPTVTITDTGGGTGATGTAVLSTYVSTALNQEVYNFSSLNSFVQQTSGVQSIQGIFSIAIMWGAPGATKPVLFNISWGVLQAYCRSYSSLVSNYPDRWAQYGQGVGGSFYLYPIPSGIYPMDLDCYCLPIALASDTDPEAIPYPWTDAIAYYAAYLALLNAQRRDDAMRMKEDYKMKMSENGMFARPVVIPSYYGRRR